MACVLEGVEDKLTTIKYAVGLAVGAGGTVRCHDLRNMYTLVAAVK